MYAFLTPTILKISIFKAYNSYGELYYAIYAHYETYLSAALSTFVPLLIAAGILLGYWLYTKKHLTQEGTDVTTAPEQ